MRISDQRFKEFDLLYKAHYGIELEPKELYERAQDLLALVRHTYTYEDENICQNMN